MRLLRNNGEPISIEPRLERLESLLRTTQGLLAAYLYGSYGTARQTPLSDVDLAFVFRPEAVPGFNADLRFRGEVLAALGEDDVSITVLNRSSVLFQHEVISTGRLLYCADPTVLADFVEGVLSRHGDYIIDHRRFLHEYDAALVEEYARG